ncbi:MAG: o-succinylbenzoate--CoA ligase [Bacteroidota bacterium]
MFEFKKRKPEKVFLTSNYGMYTYSDLDRFSAYFRHVLETHADSLSWPVAFLSQSSDVLIFALAACWKLGVPIIPLSTQLTDKELQNRIEALNPALIVTDVANRHRVQDLDSITMDDNFFLNAFTFDPKKSAPVEDHPISDDAVFGYFFTSGTTGSPKIVPLKRRQLRFAAKASAQNFKPASNHYWLLCLPLNHIGGISIIFRSLEYGSAIYRLDEFHEEMIKEFLGENLQFQAASLVPTMLKRLLNDPLFKTHHQFKAILMGGGPYSEALVRKAVERGIPIVSSYGMTETCAQIVANPMAAPSGQYTPLKSVGKPLYPNELVIRNEKGKRAGVNQSGTIWLRGPQVFDGYFQASDNEGKFDGQGWFNTGDFGHLNGFGQLFVESRRVDLIVTGGENVNPVEVEQVLEQIPAIKEAAVIGVPDDEWGQRVTAFVTLTNGAEPVYETIKTDLKKRIEPFKIPKEIHVVTELPKNELGKVKKWELNRLA